VGDLKREFAELFKASGWSQAEVARHLELTRGGVNGIITGDTEPSPALVKLFKYVLMSQKPDALKPAQAHEIRETLNREAWAEELLNELRGVDEKQRDGLIKALKEVVRSFPRTKPVRYPPLRRNSDGHPKEKGTG
jgi:transcriptional regulator with XRE-family HTH domain